MLQRQLMWQLLMQLRPAVAESQTQSSVHLQRWRRWTAVPQRESLTHQQVKEQSSAARELHQRTNLAGWWLLQQCLLAAADQSQQ